MAAAKRAAKDAATTKKNADQTVTDAKTALDTLAENATEEERGAAATTLSKAEAAAATAKAATDVTAAEAQKKVADARGAAIRTHGVLDKAVDDARAVKVAADAALAKATKEAEEKGEDCEVEPGLTAEVNGLPDKLVAGTTTTFSVRVTNGSDRHMNEVIAYTGVHATDSTGLKDTSKFFRLQWSTTSSTQWQNLNKDSCIDGVGALKAGAPAGGAGPRTESDPAAAGRYPHHPRERTGGTGHFQVAVGGAGACGGRADGLSTGVVVGAVDGPLVPLAEAAARFGFRDGDLRGSIHGLHLVGMLLLDTDHEHDVVIIRMVSQTPEAPGNPFRGDPDAVIAQACLAGRGDRAAPADDAAGARRAGQAGLGQPARGRPGPARRDRGALEHRRSGGGGRGRPRAGDSRRRHRLRAPSRRPSAVPQRGARRPWRARPAPVPLHRAAPVPRPQGLGVGRPRLEAGPRAAARR
ncbi:hypothetical protein [Streptomyces globisporus]